MEDSGETLDKVYQLYPNDLDKGLQDRRYPQQVHLTTYESENFGTKFSLRGRDCNIPGLEVTK
jgi:hypothetical protein